MRTLIHDILSLSGKTLALGTIKKIPLGLITLVCCMGIWSAVAQAETTTNANGETVNNTFLDKWYAKGSKFVTGGAERIDGFFADSESATFHQNNSYVRIRADTDYIQDHGGDFGLGLKLSLKLPGLGDRVRLVMNDDDDDSDTATPDSENQSTLGLRFLGKQTNKLGLSIDLGLRIKDSDLSLYTQLNAGVKYPLGKKWSGRTTNRLYYYTDTGFRDDFRQYFDRSFGSRQQFLLRSRTRIQYFEENVANPSWEQKFSLFHQLSSKHALAYELSAQNIQGDDSPYEADEILIPPQDEYNRIIFKIRYRRNIWRPWLFMELWPVVAWPEERDYETQFGARFRLEVYFGSIKKNAEKLDE
ncbi:hypothetical protein ACFL17_02535 [Pseudomonadota bacterium]